MCTRALLICAAALAALCAGAPAPAAGEPDRGARTPISSAAQLYTCCTPADAQERMFAEAEASGAEFVRVDVELNGIFEAAGSRERPDWRALDRMTELAQRFDIELLGILRGSPIWLSDCPERGAEAPLCAPRDPTEFGRLAGEVAEHAAGSIDHWEILNEPDARWAFKGSAEQYARMLDASYDAIKARAPEASVVFGGVERPREHEWIRRVLATPGTDIARSFDIAAVHLRVRLRNELPELADWLVGWRELLARAGFRGPIWVTEHGYPADPQFQWDPAYRGGDAAQAAFLRESLPLLAEAGAGQIFVTLRDNLFGEFLSEGLIHLNEAEPGAPALRRAAFVTVRELAASWDVVIETRARRRHHQGQALALARLARRSRQAGRALVAALQGGAVKGHLLVAERLTRELAG